MLAVALQVTGLLAAAAGAALLAPWLGLVVLGIALVLLGLAVESDTE